MEDRRERLLDELLVLRCQEGSSEALRHLVLRWQPKLWRHAFRLTGRDDAAWDVIQDSWIAIIRNISRLRDVGMFRRWAYTIVTRSAANWQRRRRRDEAVVELSHANLGSPARTESSNGDVPLLRQALPHLPGDRRAILALRYLDGFDICELAEILDIPEGTVKSRLHNARQQLRGILERLES